MSTVSVSTKAQAGDGRIKTLEQLLEETSVDLAEWSVREYTINKWDGQTTDGVEQMFQVKAQLVRKPGLSIKPAAGYPPVVPGLSFNKSKDVETAVFLPDYQIGYEWDPGFTYLNPFHDRESMDTIVQFLYDLQPDYVYILGDFLDLPEFSQFERGKRGYKYTNTTQPAIEEGFVTLRNIRESAPHAKIFFNHGNHDARLNNCIETFNAELNLLRPAQAQVPSLSIENLLRFDELSIVSSKGYDNPFWLWDKVCVKHGEEYANLNAGSNPHSVVQGHSHRIVYDLKTHQGPQGSYQTCMMSPGTLARIDGPIPRKGTATPWQQGIGIAHRYGADIHMSVLPIVNHRVITNRLATGRANSALEAELVRVTGIKQFARS